MYVKYTAFVKKRILQNKEKTYSRTKGVSAKTEVSTKEMEKVKYEHILMEV